MLELQALGINTDAIRTKVYDDPASESWRVVRIVINDLVDQYITGPINRVESYLYSLFHETA